MLLFVVFLFDKRNMEHHEKTVSKTTPCLFSLPYLELKQMNWLDRCTNRRKYQLGDKKDQQKLISLTLYNEYFHLALILV
ncbi:hypothetical protein A5885_002780 [Enterococcus sp. 8E11_MSG4843]|nr:hypothetical protein A5885_002780 [Enterococcus sp. 8E11_MSG4843]